MTFTALELKRCERDLEAFMARRRPPPHIRSQLDLGFRIEGQSVELDEIPSGLEQPGRDPARPVRKNHVRSKCRGVAAVLEACEWTVDGL
jgi:hypothetical protein